MSFIFTILLMIFGHIIADYCLQGILASMKQKEWWTKQESYNDKYKHDYIAALFMHSFCWAFCIMLPIAIICSFQIGLYFLGIFILNTLFHMLIDHFKANDKSINLVEDQFLHFVQIFFTSLMFFI